MDANTSYNKIKPKFDYETEITPFDLMKDPELIVKKMEKLSMLCLNCKMPFTFRFREEYISQKCKCGVRLFYPKMGNIYKTKYISAEEYYKNKSQKQEVLKWEKGNK